MLRWFRHTEIPLRDRVVLSRAGLAPTLKERKGHFVHDIASCPDLMSLHEWREVLERDRERLAECSRHLPAPRLAPRARGIARWVRRRQGCRSLGPGETH